LVADMRIPESIVAALTHDIFIKGCQINYAMDKPNDVDVCSLYPDTPFRTIDDCFNDLIKNSVGAPKVVEEPISNDAIIAPNSKPEALVITA
jgi:leucoanthocyanidin reductase